MKPWTAQLFTLLLTVCLIVGGVQASCATCSGGLTVEVRAESGVSDVEGNCCAPTDDFANDWQPSEGTDDCECCSQDRCEATEGLTDSPAAVSASSAPLVAIVTQPGALLSPPLRLERGIVAPDEATREPARVYLKNASFLC